MPINVGSIELCVLGDIAVGSVDAQEVYVGPTKVFPCASDPGTGLCLSMDNSKICLPWADAGFVGGIANGTWYLEMEFIIDAGYPTTANVPLFEEEPDCITNCAFSSSLDFSSGEWRLFPFRLSENVGQSVSANPGADVAIDSGNLVRLRVGYDGVNDDLQVTWDNLTKVLNKTGYHTVMKPSQLTAPSTTICLGAAIQWTNNLFTGSMQNVLLVQNDVTLGQWPIQNYIQPDGTVLDISGNNNHGIVTLGAGNIGACP